MIQATAARVADFAPPLVICNHEHRFLVAEQLREACISPDSIVLERDGRNTAPAAAIAALLIAAKDPDAVLLLMPADHIITDNRSFLDAVAIAAAAARSGSIVTFGVMPHKPETGYGYIQRGAPADVEGCFQVARFAEKPDRATAQRYIEGGDYLWNSGMFAFTASTYLQEMARLEPEMLEACQSAIASGIQDGDFFRLGEQAFERCKSQSIDYAIMEHTNRAAVVPAEMGWTDVGTWSALWDICDRDAAGNMLNGDVISVDTQNSYVRSEGPLVATVGIRDLVVVATNDSVLIAERSASQNVKEIVACLTSRSRSEALHHRRVLRPWGSYDSVDSGPGFQVKHIVVKPGAKLSLQLHHKRSEYWVVVSGTARVTNGDEEFELYENESTFIPVGMKHRLENPAPVPLHLIETQCGSYLGEDDIVRFEDNYGRA